MSEIERAIDGYEEYLVSESGIVYSTKTKTYLKPTVNRYGYPCVVISNENGRKNIPVHRLVAAAFIDNPNNYRVINHKDENKQNNSADNLEWCTDAYNVTYMGAAKKRGIKLRKPIIAKNIDTGVETEYDGLCSAEKATGATSNNICMVCSGKRSSSQGYLFRYRYEPKGEIE